MSNRFRKIRMPSRGVSDAKLSVVKTLVTTFRYTHASSVSESSEPMNSASSLMFHPVVVEPHSRSEDAHVMAVDQPWTWISAAFRLLDRRLLVVDLPSVLCSTSACVGFWRAAGT
jgi:hypothetical protein